MWCSVASPDNTFLVSEASLAKELADADTLSQELADSDVPGQELAGADALAHGRWTRLGTMLDYILPQEPVATCAAKSTDN